jgi:hypothetical protein
MQLCFVSVHGPRETYFVDEPRTSAILHPSVFHSLGANEQGVNGVTSSGLLPRQRNATHFRASCGKTSPLEP